jgi:ABC-type transporter Mla MlaB component
MASKKNSVIGFDPLAWMKEDSRESSVVSRQSTPATDEPRPAAHATDHPSTPKTEDRRPMTGDTPSAAQLGDVLTIEQAAALYAELGRHLGAKSVMLEAGALQRVDAAGLQLLAAFVRAARARGTQVEWRAPTAVLRDAARRTGLTAALQLA